MNQQRQQQQQQQLTKQRGKSADTAKDKSKQEKLQREREKKERERQEKERKEREKKERKLLKKNGGGAVSSSATSSALNRFNEFAEPSLSNSKSENVLNQRRLLDQPQANVLPKGRYRCQVAYLDESVKAFDIDVRYMK